MMKLQTYRQLFSAIGFAVLVPLVFVTNHVYNFFPFVDPSQTLHYYLRQLAFSLLCFAFLYLIFRRADKAGFVLVMFLFLFYFFSPFHDSLKTVTGKGFISQYRFLLPAILLASILAIFLIRSTTRDFSRINNYILLVLGIYILIDSGRLAVKAADPVHAGSVKPITDRIILQENNVRNRPDIFLIVIDEYASSKSLKEQFDFDNTSIDSFFVQQGFEVLKYSKSNYNRTHFSIASLLNLSYVYTPHPFSLNNEDYLGAKNLLKYNKVMDFFHNVGYDIRNHSAFDYKYGDAPLHFDFVTNIVSTMQSHTLINKINRDIGWPLRVGKIDTTFIHNRMENMDVLHNTLMCRLSDEAEANPAVPRFVYSHFFLAHSPFMMDGSRKRSTMEVSRDSEESQVQNYLNNIPSVNEKVRKMVTSIMKGTKGNAIIIVMGDHGFRSWHYQQDMPSYFENFCAIYRPGNPVDSIQPGMTSVNLFRDLLNKEFGQKLPLLNDSLFFLIDSP